MPNNNNNLMLDMQGGCLLTDESMVSQPDYVRFEKLKSELSPDLNPSEYEGAVRAIAMECDL